MHMETEQAPIGDKYRILEHLNQIYWHQFGYHREKEYRIFIWTSAILLAGMAGMMTASDSTITLLRQYGIVGKVIASAFVLLWIGISIWMQLRERRHGDRYSGVLVRISRNLHCFEEGFFDQTQGSALFPRNWEMWELEESPKYNRLIFKNFIPVTFVLGMMAMIVLWAY